MTEVEEDCPCEATKYGCCLNGIDRADGPLFEGCPDIPKPQCHLPPEKGPCMNYTDKVCKLNSYIYIMN